MYKNSVFYFEGPNNATLSAVSTQNILCDTMAKISKNINTLIGENSVNFTAKNPAKTVRAMSTNAKSINGILYLWEPSRGLPNKSLY